MLCAARRETLESRQALISRRLKNYFNRLVIRATDGPAQVLLNVACTF